MKKHIFILFCFVYLITLFGCGNYSINNNFRLDNVISVNEDIEEENESVIYSDKILSSNDEITYKNVAKTFYNKINIKYGYNSLNSKEEQNLYILMEENMSKISNEKDEKGFYLIKFVNVNGAVLNASTIQKVFRAFKYDNPEVFWIGNEIKFIRRLDSTTVKFKSVVSPDECKKIVEELNKEMSYIFSKIPLGLSEYERELYLHDLIVTKCTYDKNYTKSNSWRAFTIVGVLLDNKAVCEGYSKAMQYLLCNVGIECRVITGKKKNEAHMWNLVKIKGNWYHVDSTWDSSNKISQYDYFNLNDKAIKYDHLIDEEYNENNLDSKNYIYNFKLPKCVSLEENYFYKNALRLDSFDEKSDNYMIEEIKKAIIKKDRYIRIIISSKMDYSSTVSKMFSDKPYKFFYYLNKIDKSTITKNKIDKKKMYFVENRSLNAITVELNYLQ